MTHDQDRALKIAALISWQAAIESASAKIEPVMTLLKLPPESPVFEAVSGLKTALTTVVMDAFDDADEWLAWYWLENDMGREGLEASPDGHERRPIMELDDLLWLLDGGKEKTK